MIKPGILDLHTSRRVEFARRLTHAEDEVRLVTCMCTRGAEGATRVWADGRVASVRGTRASASVYGFAGFARSARRLLQRARNGSTTNS